jgi:hypothetical protein
MSPSISPTIRLGALLLAGIGLVALAVPAGAATTAPAVPVTVSVTQPFTDTGLDVQQGATITIHAGGQVQYRSRHVRKADPDGVPWGKACRDIASQASSAPFPAPGLSCWSLVGKIGADGKPFEVGKSATFLARTNGKLLLGINDNYLPDNSGSWVVAVSGAGALPSKSSSGSSKVPLIALLIGLALIAIIIWWALRRRRKPSSPAKPRKAPPASKARAKPKPEPKPEPALAAAAAIAATRSSESRPSGTPLDPESTDVNIFKVELTDRDNLEVGYNFFPEGTTVTWRVAQNGATFASGDFVTEGGGADRHFESIPLGTTIGAGTETVDVYFSWRIGDVPFGYNVRRDTDA